MTEEEYEKVDNVVKILSDAMTTLVNETLAYARKTECFSDEQEDLVRTHLSEQMRFWK